MSEYINIVGIQFKYQEFLLYCDWLLLFGMVFIVYAAYSTGTAREKKEKRNQEKREVVKEESDEKPLKATSSEYDHCLFPLSVNFCFNQLRSSPRERT